MNVLDLFSGIGGFSLGLERAGMRTVAFCEINEYCRGILNKHWPNVPVYEDVRTLTADRLRADGIIPDAICGGFPCQDISLAGPGEGLKGARSGLWFQYARLIEEIRPRWVIIENVAALRSRGLGVVLGFLSSLGYDAEWHCIPASAVGAPHRRDRLWIMAHATRHERWDGREEIRRAWERTQPGSAGGGGPVEVEAISEARSDVSNTEGVTERAGLCAGQPGWLGRGRSGDLYSETHPWAVEPGMGRVADGVSYRVDRLSALGNAVVPQIPELIGRAIMTSVQTL